jgi:hypothetical protein
MSILKQNQITPTMHFLSIEFGNRALIPLEEVADRYLSIGANTAKRRASEGVLPFPVLRLGDSQKSPYLVQMTVLAEYVETKCNYAFTEWKKCQF